VFVEFVALRLKYLVLETKSSTQPLKNPEFFLPANLPFYLYSFPGIEMSVGAYFLSIWSHSERRIGYFLSNSPCLPVKREPFHEEFSQIISGS
jgi:hypothetical protein